MRAGTARNVHVITLGCAKNLVDSEKLMAQLRRNGFGLADTLEEADVAVINTCGFIEPAKQESLDVLMETARSKGNGRLKAVYAFGCLTERYPRELKKGIPEIDGIFGSNDVGNLLRALGGDLRRDLLGERVLTTPPHTAYLKVSEGCDHPCSFCAIPRMRGKHASRPAPEIVAEATQLAGNGAREIILIGQDTTSYGLDLSGTRQLPSLLRTLGDIDGVEWLRLMYAYPSHFPLEVFDVMAGHGNVCRYLDIPVQHISDHVLRSMRRGTSRRALLNLLDTARKKVPGIALRTTLIVGYPSEGEKEFLELLDFVREVKFDRLGVFTYSREDGTTAFPLGDPVPAPEKERRLAEIMKTQQEISLARNASLVGTRQKVLIDRREGAQWVGRSEADAPEIDNETYVTTGRLLRPGDFCTVDIHSSSEYDLYGSS